MFVMQFQKIPIALASTPRHLHILPKKKNMSRKCLLLALVLLWYSNLFSQVGSLPAGQLATTYFQDAEAALIKKDYKQAIRLYEKALKLQPGLTAAHKGLAACYELLRDYQQALVHYENVIATDSMFSRVMYYQMAEAYYKQGYYDKALTYFQQYERLQDRPFEDFGLNGERELSQEKKLQDKLPNAIKACQVSLDSLKFLNITEVFNMGNGINSKADDYFPFLSNNQDYMFFTRRKSGVDEDLYLSRKDGGNWQSAQPLRAFNTDDNEGMCTFVRDGRHMFFTACGREGIGGTCDIWLGEIDDQQNLVGVSAMSEGANSGQWDSQASISCDGATLYFASNRPKGFGGTDIWVCHKLSDGRWSEPVNLGPKINTPQDEEAPYITNDSKTLYFSSTGHLGMGEQDLFMSWLDERNNQWSTPINLGPPVNTAYRELGVFLSADGKTGYFASDRPGGSGGMDIYRFALSDKLYSDPITFVEGYVRDSVLMTPIKTVVDIAGRGKYATDDNGRFFLCVKADETLQLGLKHRGFKDYKNKFVIPEWSNRTFYTVEVLLQPTFSFLTGEAPKLSADTIAAQTSDKNRKKKDLLHTVFFDFDKSAIDASELTRMDDFIKTLRKNDIVRVEIIGFADDIGAEVYNLRLSEERAKGIALFLVQNNIVVDQIYLEGKGELKNEDPKARNRKVEVKITVWE